MGVNDVVVNGLVTSILVRFRVVRPAMVVCRPQLGQRRASANGTIIVCAIVWASGAGPGERH